MNIGPTNFWGGEDFSGLPSPIGWIPSLRSWLQIVRHESSLYLTPAPARGLVDALGAVAVIDTIRVLEAKRSTRSLLLDI